MSKETYLVKDLEKLIRAVENIDGGCGTCITRFLDIIEPELALAITKRMRINGEVLFLNKDGEWDY